MSSKKIIALTLVVSILLGNKVLAQPLDKNEGVNPVPINRGIKEDKGVKAYILNRSIKEENEYIKVDIKLPLILGVKDWKYQLQLNSILMDHAIKDKQAVEEDAKRQAEACKKYEITFKQLQLSMNYEVKNNNDILSFVVTTYIYSGGANGNIRVDTYNIDLKEQKNIYLSDLFREGSDFKNIVNNEITNQIKVQSEKGEQFFKDDMGFKSISDAQNFYIKDDNLVILFQKYEIAPGVKGIPEFVIPMKNLNYIMKKPQPLIAGGNYYNWKYNFKFRIPPIWSSKIEIIENYDVDGAVAKVDFVYNPQDTELKKEVLASISVINSGQYKKPEGIGLHYKIAETEAYVYVISMPIATYDKESEDGKAYSKLREALDGIDDLFKVVNVKDEIFIQ
jgi:hypothetical protein